MGSEIVDWVRGGWTGAPEKQIPELEEWFTMTQLQCARPCDGRISPMLWPYTAKYEPHLVKRVIQFGCRAPLTSENIPANAPIDESDAKL